MDPNELYISVDIESSGPVPGRYSMLSLGACVVGDPSTSFYAELRPISNAADPKALAVSGLDMALLRLTGEEPAAAIGRLRDWVRACALDREPVFVAFNAGFDWSFVNWYFHEFLGENPFGFGGVDIKAFYMGLAGCLWRDTRSSRLPEEFQSASPLTHNALDDARAQAEVFQRMLAEARRGKQ